MNCEEVRREGWPTLSELLCEWIGSEFVVDRDGAENSRQFFFSLSHRCQLNFAPAARCPLRAPAMIRRSNIKGCAEKGAPAAAGSLPGWG